MRLCFGALATLVAVIVPIPARAADAAVKPIAVLRLKSIDGLLDDARYLAKYMGLEEESKQIEPFIRGIIGDTIDTKRPLGAYGWVRDKLPESGGIWLIPVTKAEDFVALLGRFGFTSKKGSDDIYQGTSEGFPLPVPVYFRFANNYAYFTALNKESLAADKLIDPVKVLALAPAKTISAVIHLSDLSQGQRTILASGIDQKMGEEQQRARPGETKAQKDFREAAINELANNMAMLVNEGGDFAAFLDVDQKTKQVVAEASLSGQPNSKLAANIAALGKSMSLFGGLPKTDAALSLVVHASLPETMRKALVPVIDEGLQKLLQNQKDEVARKQTQKLIEAAQPTLQAGELDLGIVLHGPTMDKHYTAVAGIKVKNGTGIDEFLRGLVRILPERDRSNVKLDAESAGGVKIHQINAQDKYEEGARRLVGESPLFVAIRNDAVLLGVGPDGLRGLKAAANIQAQPSSIANLEVALAHMGPIISQTAKSSGQPERAEEYIAKAVKDSFSGKPGQDLVHLSLTGGNALQLRYTIQPEALTFFSKMAPRAAALPGRPKP